MINARISMLDTGYMMLDENGWWLKAQGKWFKMNDITLYLPTTPFTFNPEFNSAFSPARRRLWPLRAGGRIPASEFNYPAAPKSLV